MTYIFNNKITTKLIIFLNFIIFLFSQYDIFKMGIGDWGLGIGDWRLGIGPNPQSPIPNPQSPIPYKCFKIKFINIFRKNLNYNKKIIFIKYKNIKCSTKMKIKKKQVVITT